jgi:hypothetical protein
MTSLLEQIEGLNGPILLAVSGGRDYTDATKVDHVLGTIHKTVGIELLIQGECHVGHGGLDELSRKWAKKNEVNCMSVPAKSRKYSWPAAGPMRNNEMAAMKPCAWALFPGGKGTDSARRIAQEKGIRIIEVSYVDE